MKHMKKVTSIVVMLVLVLNLMPVINGGTSKNTILASDGDYETYADVLESISDTKELSVEIDYSNMNSAAICLVRTGDTDVQMLITDEDGNTVAKLPAVETNARRWVFLDAPATDTQTVTYTVTVTVYNGRMGKDGSFRLMVGDKNDTEKMISGIKNAVNLNLYTEEQGNQFFTYYTPDNYESWYRFTPKEAETVITLLTKNQNITGTQYINVGYRMDALNNVKANGKWLFSFKTTSSVPSLTLIPGIYISYYYEIGD